MRDWKQKLAIYLLVAGLTFLALVESEYRHIIIGMLVPLVIWVIERKDKIEAQEQKEKQVKTQKEKRQKGPAKIGRKKRRQKKRRK